MSETTDSCTGHAAVGEVTGTRTEDGQRPPYVRITYVRNGVEQTAVVKRESAGQQVEFSDADTARFWTPDGQQVIVDELIDTEPVMDYA